MGIPLNLDFTMGVAKPIDSRFVMTKAEMLAANDAVMPPVYGCWCSDDGRPYIYNKSNTPSATLGKFVPADEKAVEAYSMALNHDSFLTGMFRLQDRISQLEKAEAKSEFVNSIDIAEGSIKTNILPDHPASKFCRKLAMTYSGTLSGTSAEPLKINNKAVAFDNDITAAAGEHTFKFEVYESETASKVLIAKKTIDYGTVNETSVSAELSDSFVLTIEVTTATDAETAALSYNLERMDYADVILDYPYPVLELRDGSVVYRENLSGTTGMYTTGMANHLGGMFDIFACYQLGNTATYLQYCFVVNHNNQYYSPYEGCEYVYMANWYWLENCTQLLWCFTTLSFDKALQTNQSKIKKLDFSKIRLKKLNSLGYGNFFYGYSGDFISEDLLATLFEKKEGNYSGDVQLYLENIEYFDFSKFRLDKFNDNAQINLKCGLALRSLGDLTNWDTSRLQLGRQLLSNCPLLEYAGDIAKWDTSHFNAIGNMFKGDFNLRIGAEIENWDISNCTTIAWTFESCNYIGDETLSGLGKWDTSNCENFRGTFSYLYEDGFKENGRVYNYYKRKHMQYPPEIVNKRTDLSFVDKWDVKKGIQFEGFFANNPYLVNVGDLRKWELDALIANPSAAANKGFTGFIMGCSALETIKMPSIPRGVDVLNFAKGCTSLANIELNELNVEAISFEDCPLTKQSVLNLVNAATADVTITLSATVYAAMSVDADVTAAIQAKAGSNINIVLASNE